VSDEVNIDLAPDGTVYGIELLNANEQMRAADGCRLVVIDEEQGRELSLPLICESRSAPEFMRLTLAIALYFVIWWTVLFAVLPFGLRTQGEDGAIVPGTPESAPAAPRLWRIALINTVVATLVFAAVWAAIVYRVIAIEDVPAIGR
jgi:predicted secreted protein